MVRVEPPQPGVIHVHGAELGKPRVNLPRALALMRLEQALQFARVNASGDDNLDFHALPRKRVLDVSVTAVGEAPGVSQAGGGQDARGVFRFQVPPVQHVLKLDESALCRYLRCGFRPTHSLCKLLDASAPRLGPSARPHRLGTSFRCSLTVDPAFVPVQQPCGVLSDSPLHQTARNLCCTPAG